MRRRLVAATALVVAGIVVLALPDSDRRLFSLSEEHGPSAVDALGAGISILGWLVAGRELWARRRSIVERTAGATLVAGAFATGVGAGLLVASVLGDFAWWWAIGAAVLAGVQVAAFVSLLRGAEGSDDGP